MTQTTVLAAGNTAETSTDIVVLPGDVVTVALFSSAEQTVPSDAKFDLLLDSPGLDMPVATLNSYTLQFALYGPGTYRVTRNAYAGAAFGVYTES